MRRRRFLASAASAFPLALAQPIARALSGAVGLAPDSKELHVVAEGEDRFGETHSRGYSRILFKSSTADTAGNMFVIEHKHLTGGGPPLHVHLEQEEWFYVMEGEVLFQVGEKRVRLKPGDSVLGPRKIPHAFTPVSATPARMLIAFTPAGKMEQFFRETAVPNPPKEDAAFFRRFDMELLGPPIKV